MLAQNTTTFQATSGSQVTTLVVNHQAPAPPGDTDRNGLPDAWELQYFGLTGNSPAGDADNDGSTNLQEFQAGTDPTTPPFSATDTDNDGLPDAWETRYFGTLDYGPDDQFNNMDRNLLGYYQQGLVPRLYTPTVVAGLRAWYRADTGYFRDPVSGKVNLWTDLSGNGLHLRQTEAAAQPENYSSETGEQFMFLSGAQRMAASPADVMVGATDLTVFVVLRPAPDQADNASLIALGSETSSGFDLRQLGPNANQYALVWPRAADQSPQGAAAAITAVADQSQLLTLLKGNTSQLGYLNGELQATASVAADLHALPAQLSLGGLTGGAFSGAVYEVLIYNRALSAEEREEVEDDLLLRNQLNDLDRSGLPDRWERRHFGHIGVDPNADADSDGLSNRDEWQRNTDPMRDDSDADGLSDGKEIALGTDPNDPASRAPLQLTWLSRSSTTSYTGEEIRRAPGLAGLLPDSSKNYRKIVVNQTVTEDVPPLGPPYWDESDYEPDLGLRTFTAEYNPDDPENWRISGRRVRRFPEADPEKRSTYPMDSVWLGADPAATSDSTKHVEYELIIHPRYLDSVDVVIRVSYDITLSEPGDAEVIPPQPQSSTGSWTPQLPSASRSGSTSVSAEYLIAVPSGAVGTIRWFEVFTPADGGAKAYALQEWPIENGATKSPGHTLSCPADGTATVELLEFTGQLAVDANRDGEIKLLGEEGADLTSATRPYRFWVNDDDDHLVDSSITGVYSELEDDDRNITNVQNEDWRNNVIDTPRDLEDFARLWVSVPGLSDSLKNGQLYLGLKWKNMTGTPAIKLHRSKDAAGSADYLFNTSAAAQQSLTAAIIEARYPDYVLDGNFQSDHTLIEGSGVFIIPAVQFSALSESTPSAAYLLEGCKAGVGQLVLVILKKEGTNYTEIGEGPGVWLDLKAPKNFIERWSAGNDALGVVQPVVRENSKSVSPAWGNPVTEEEKDYVLYVHGYNMQEFEKQRWIETTYKRLYWLGYKGRVGGFTWPCSQSAPPYDASEERAWESAVQLRILLSGLKTAGYRVHVLAHSQGNVVAGEALRQWKEAGNTTPLVRTYIASQAAIQAHCYDMAAPLIPGFAGSVSDDGTPNVYVNYPPTGAPYMGALAMSGAATNWLNFENPRDYALTGNSLDPLDFHPGWQANQRLKPDADTGMGYNAVDGFFISTPTGIRSLVMPAERFKIFSYLAEGRSWALGSTATGGVFAGNNTDLEATLGYSREHRYHSAQFRSFMSERYEYWRRLMLGIDLQPFTP